MSANAKNKLRQRIQEIKNKIDDAEEKERVATDLLKDTEAKSYELEKDIDSIGNKITLTKQALDEKNAELDRKLKKVQELEHKLNQENELVKALEHVEMDGDERLDELECQLKKNEEFVRQREVEINELRMKGVQLERELGRAVDREGEALLKLENLNRHMIKARSDLDELKGREESAYEREDEGDKKSSFLQKEVSDKEAEAEEKERLVAKLENDRDTFNAELKDWKNRIEGLKDELQKIEEIDDF